MLAPRGPCTSSATRPTRRGGGWKLLDAIAGFNHIVNAERARHMLASLARSKQFLPTSLTNELRDGSEDFLLRCP
eukprot:1021107-Lingulodinium_polyedra.AAC.1